MDTTTYQPLSHWRQLIIAASILLLAPALVIAEPDAATLAAAGVSELEQLVVDAAGGVGNATPGAAWLEANGTRIGEIILDKHDVFDTDQPRQRKSLFRLANRLHIDTRDSTIRTQLLFNEGDPYSTRILEESERLLRKNRYFYDAHIYPSNYRDGVVDIVVSTRDVWTLSLGFSASRKGGTNRTNLELEENNLLGLGSKLSVDVSSDVDRDSTRFEYSDSHIGDSFVRTSLMLTSSSDGDTTEFELERPFYSLDTRWAAGFDYYDDDRIDSVYDLGKVVASYNHSHTMARLYAGKSQGLIDGWVSRWKTGLVVDDSIFRETPSDFTAQVMPENRKYAYPFIAYELFEDRYAETSNQDQIDRTEDVHLGTHFTAQLGWSDKSFGAGENALLYELSTGTGFGVPQNKMLLLDAALHGMTLGDKASRTQLGLQARYYKRQSEKRLFFSGVAIDLSDNPALDELLEIGGTTGLRGYPLRYQVGKGRALVSLEQRYFTDWYPFQLIRVGGAIFADAGRTWGHNAVGSESLGWLADVGFGLRLAPTRSSSGKLLHLDIAFPLNAPADIDSVQFLLEARKSF
ncbi:MAG: hypothetical protein WBM54_04915 [Woeseia sp.]